MTTKIDPFAAAPALMKSWMSASLAAAASLEPSLVSLVEVRASQVNGCANCINMHTIDARGKGETEQRLVAAIYVMRNPDKLRHLH
jgi:AhpD family alkylhydroperoxidase